MLEEVCLNIEEAEAIRLKDVQDLDQEGSALQMNISRPTFQRILESARKKMADALLGGKAIRIVGGNFQMAEQNPEWNQMYEQGAKLTQPGMRRCLNRKRHSSGNDRPSMPVREREKTR